VLITLAKDGRYKTGKIYERHYKPKHGMESEQAMAGDE